MIRLRTPRLVLRQWRDDDREPFAALNADPEVMEHFPSPLSRDQSDALVDGASATIAERGWGLWAVEAVEGDGPQGFIGFTGLAEPRFDAHFTPAVEVGWRLARRAWGHGYATEAGAAAVEYGFAEVGLRSIVSFTAEGNVRSRAVMERLGMRHRRADDFDHPRIPEGDPLRRTVLYRLRA